MTLKWQAVFFDFDGVIADSVQVKTEAFAIMFGSYGKEVVDQVIHYHLANGGMPRYQKLTYFYEEVLDQALDQQQLQKLGKQFSSLVLEGVIQAPYIQGALESLKLLQEKGVPAFVVSGTPHEEMQVIVQQRELTPYFTEVHGSPRSKTEIVKELLGRYQCTPEQCLFIGDALADYTAAVNTGTRFLGIKSSSGAVSFPDGALVSPVVRLDI